MLLKRRHYNSRHLCLTNTKNSFTSTEKPREACFDPGNIMNGSRTGYDYKLGSQVSYSCHHGYTIVGSETVMCVMGKDGKPVWDKALPSCKGKKDTEACFYFCFNKTLHTKFNKRKS